MMAGLMALARHPKQHEHDWNVNPITARCIGVYNQRVRGYNAKRTIQGAIMLYKLRIRNVNSWD